MCVFSAEITINTLQTTFFCTFLGVGHNLSPYSKPAVHDCSNQYTYFPEDFSGA